MLKIFVDCKSKKKMKFRGEVLSTQDWHGAMTPGWSVNRKHNFELLYFPYRLGSLPQIDMDFNIY